MSDMTECNYCSFKLIKKRAKAAGEEVTKWGSIGVDIYVHPADIDIKALPDKEKEGYFRAWFMELTDYCAC